MTGADPLDEDRLRELYVERDYTVREVARHCSTGTATVLAALRETDFYEPKTATLLAEATPGDEFG